MPWVVLLASAVLEAVWASALAASDGLSRPVPTRRVPRRRHASMVGLAPRPSHHPHRHGVCRVDRGGCRAHGHVGHHSRR